MYILSQNILKVDLPEDEKIYKYIYHIYSRLDIYFSHHSHKEIILHQHFPKS